MIFSLLSLLVLADETAVADALRARLDEVPRAGVAAAGEPLLTEETLRAFYAERAYRPVWTRSAELASSADELAGALGASTRSGLDPELYHFRRIEIALAAARERALEAPALADLELLLTDAFFLYGAHVLDGRVDSRSLAPRWRVPEARRAELRALLSSVSEGRSVASALGSLEPTAADYARLEGALAFYRGLAARGGWPLVPEGPKLSLGSSGERVLALAARLGATGELEGATRTRFDDSVEAAVVRFQERHGLEPDGVVGARTLEALNATASSRAREIELALERWRWLPEDLGPRYVLVDVPFFDLELVEEGRRSLAMRVVVGRPARETPDFSATLTHAVFDPTWYVPPTIAREDVLPELRRDPSYLDERSMRVVDAASGREVDPSSIDWSAVSADALPYAFRQGPGPLNPLGRVKFTVPNPYDVCLHDTPSRGLFARAERTASSGCIRLERPIELAERLLGPEWPPERIAEVLDRGAELSVPLARPIEVHLIYVTSRAREDGVVEFRRDVYERNPPLDRALLAMSSRFGS